MTPFQEKITDIVNDYLTAFQVPYAELSDLDDSERQDLLTTLMEEIGIAIEPEEMDRLLEKSDLGLSDIIVSFESGEPLDYEF